MWATAAFANSDPARPLSARRNVIRHPLRWGDFPLESKHRSMNAAIAIAKPEESSDDRQHDM